MKSHQMNRTKGWTDMDGPMEPTMDWTTMRWPGIVTSKIQSVIFWKSYQYYHLDTKNIFWRWAKRSELKMYDREIKYPILIKNISSSGKRSSSIKGIHQIRSGILIKRPVTFSQWLYTVGRSLSSILKYFWHLSHAIRFSRTMELL